MAFSYYNRLNSEQKRTYRRSDEIKLALPPDVKVGELIKQLEQSLKAEQRAQIQAICQELIGELTRAFKVPRVNVIVLAVRPNNSGGELHGFYEPMEEGKLAKISIWMRTAQRRQVVAFKTFLRTLIHELCHHLDYELFQLPETFHTEGFYKRESTLMYTLLGQASGRETNSKSTPADRLKSGRTDFSAARLLSELREKSRGT
jgi:hypothetical protein